MTIPSSSPGHTRNTRSACFPPQEPSNQSNSIGHGVNSHRINFQLNHLPNLAKVGTVVGGSCGESPKIDDAINNLKPRLLELCEKSSCLVSFGSRNSFERITQGSCQDLKFNSSSLIEQILVQINTARTDGITLSDTVKLKSINGHIMTNQDSQGYLKGQIRFQISGDPAERVIDFLEFSPEYNGNNLSSTALLSALSHLPNTDASDKSAPTQASNPTCLQFYSASGIGRSASLAVLHSFKEMCKQHNGFLDHEIEGHLSTLIKQGREQRSKYFVNSREQEKELLDACVQVNKQIKAERKQARSEATRANNSALLGSNEVPTPAASQIVRQINDAVITLTTTAPVFNKQPDKFPYMPINVNGIGILAGNNDFQFPDLSIEQAKNASVDVIKAGFYGDALGAELESVVYRNKRLNLIRAAGYTDEKSFNNSVRNPSEQDQILVHQLKQNNRRSLPTAHQATDDTQQGMLSMISKMNWIAKGKQNLNELAGNTMLAFKEPEFPAHSNNNSGVKFEIRGGANTIYMCKFTNHSKQEWHQVAIENATLIKDNNRRITGIISTGERAGGAGNGGMMRIGYDLLPMLASNCTTQDLIEQALISNQITHPSSFSAVASVGQVILMAKCLHFRQKREQEGLSNKLPKNFFIDTYYDVAKELEHREQKFKLLDGHSLVPAQLANWYSPWQWRTERLPSDFLKCSAHNDHVINAGSVEQALIDSQYWPNTSQNIDLVLQRWSSNSYLGATFPTVVFLLEKFGYDNPAQAVNMAALVTKDSDTCATIIAQAMGALHGSKWVERELSQCRDQYNNQTTFNTDLGGGFTLDNLIAYTENYFDDHKKPSVGQTSV